MEIEKALKEGLESRMKEEGIKIAKGLLVDFENELNQKIAGIALDVSSQVSVMNSGTEIVIRIIKE